MKLHRLPISSLALLLALGPLSPGCLSASEQVKGFETPRPGKISAVNKRRLKPMIDAVAKRRGLDAALVHAVIAAESGYNPGAVSPKGAIGLMQIMPETAGDYGIEVVDRLYDPKTNVETGTRHLKRLMRKYKNMRQAIMAYNAGEGAVERAPGGTVTYSETRHYTTRVLNNYLRSKGKKPIKLIAPTKARKLRKVKMRRSGRVKVVINSTVGNLDPGLHSFGPESKPLFVLESKD